MPKKIGVLDVHQHISARPQTFIKKSAAQLLVRRLFAEWLIENVVIRRLAIKREQNPIPGRVEQVSPTWCRRNYEHHIEPKLEHLPTLDKLVSEWRCQAMYWNDNDDVEALKSGCDLKRHESADCPSAGSGETHKARSNFCPDCGYSDDYNTLHPYFHRCPNDFHWYETA